MQKNVNGKLDHLNKIGTGALLNVVSKDVDSLESNFPFTKFTRNRSQLFSSFKLDIHDLLRKPDISIVYSSTCNNLLFSAGTNLN